MLATLIQKEIMHHILSVRFVALLLRLQTAPTGPGANIKLPKKKSNG